MTVNIAAFSLHRYEHFVGHLAQAGALARFYYAHRLSTDHRRLGIAADQAVNVFLPAYLAGAHMRYAPPTDTGTCYDFHSALWQAMVLRRWRPAAVLQTVIGYRVEKLMARAKRDSAAVLAHAVTPYWGRQLDLEREEWCRLGLDDRGRRWTMTPEQRRQYELADYFMVDSRFSRDTLTDAGIAAGRIFIVPPAAHVPPSPLVPAEQPADGVFRVLVVGRLDPVKGHRYLLEAWRRSALPAAELIFVGGATAATPAILAGYDGLYRHIPQSPFADVAALMRRASVVVLPTVCDGWGQVTVEALACGVPVIVTANAGSADCVKDGVNGFVVPARDPDALAQALETLHRDPDLRAVMAAEARKSAAEVGGWDAYAARLLNIYAAVAPERGGKRETAPESVT
ncbi:glycosyltransferase family 4 protein [Azospirillum griseum]|uniref:Glycosyltransferase family 1 protein n=1 Tax=Azospirillum griseum TaxID=2496639 RepID=A0A431VAH9_9PROT|nr:glycosyltransferase family 4 protein [Azospirillum griseum]RTR14171.1 glycosyltransferase family 1 protein [Azospirillum griseum]